MSGPVKIKSLSRSRRSHMTPSKEENVNSQITEDHNAQISNLEAILSSPKARPTRLCSTPIQKNLDLIEDSPDQDICDSPTALYPCTQDSNEIAWDWQSGLNKETDSPGRVDKLTKNSLGGLNNTPKRPQQLFPRKRVTKAYSPLLNVTNKRKLVNDGAVESMHKFAAGLDAVVKGFKIKPESDNNEKIKKDTNEIIDDIKPGTSIQSEIFDLETQAPSDIHEITTLEVSYIAEEKTDPEKPESSLDDLFDNSIDACMIQCSQEVEDKLKLSSGGAESKLIPVLSNDGQKSISHVATRSVNLNTGLKSCNVNIQSRYDTKIEKPTSVPNLTSREKLASNGRDIFAEKDIQASQIPDDSFDDCLALCLEDDDELMSKFLLDKKPGVSNKPNSVQTLNSHDGNSSFKRKQQCMGPETSHSRKYFKTKSLSDSYCGNSILGKNGINNFPSNSNLGRSYPPPTAKSGSNYNLGGKFGTNGVQEKVSSTPNLNNYVPAAGGRTSSNGNLKTENQSNNVSYSYIRNGINKIEVSKVNSGNHDPYATSGKRDEKSLKELRTTMPTNSQYNAREIEKKRLEAKMRLEANKKRNQVNFNRSNGPGLGLPNQRPVIKR